MTAGPDDLSLESVMRETEATRRIAEALDPLTGDERRRVLTAMLRFAAPITRIPGGATRTTIEGDPEVLGSYDKPGLFPRPRP